MKNKKNKSIININMNIVIAEQADRRFFESCLFEPTHCLAIPEILENIFSYITDYKDFVKLLRVNRIWQLEAVRAILKLYRNKFYRYNHNILNILLISDFYSNIFGVHKPVYNKIYRLG